MYETPHGSPRPTQSAMRRHPHLSPGTDPTAWPASRPVAMQSTIGGCCWLYRADQRGLSHMPCLCCLRTCCNRRLSICNDWCSAAPRFSRQRRSRTAAGPLAWGDDIHASQRPNLSSYLIWMCKLFIHTCTFYLLRCTRGFIVQCSCWTCGCHCWLT